MPRFRLLAVATAVALTGCGGASGDSGDGPDATRTSAFVPPKLDRMDRLEVPEGVLDVLAPAGYAEDGSTDAAVDWVTPFEKQTGCQVNLTVAPGSDGLLDMLATGAYDVVAAPGDISLQLIAAGDVEPVNTELVPNFDGVVPALTGKAWNSVNGTAYGVPQGRGANLLTYRTDRVKPTPESWQAVFDAASAHRGLVTAYDSPIAIADAAVYLMATRPDLGITNPYALDRRQLDAGVELLTAQRDSIGTLWSDPLVAAQAFQSGAAVIGATSQAVAHLAKSQRAPVEVVLPSEGATGWSTTWMVVSRAEHRTCAYLWLDHTLSPAVNARIAEHVGAAPATEEACAETADPQHCDTFHARDETFFDQIWYWTTPIAQCLDGRTDVSCTEYADWTDAWREITE